MSSRYWLKLYHEMLDDPKVALLRDRLYRRFIECLLLAGDTDKDGNLPDLCNIAFRFRVDAEQLETELGELAHAGLLVNDGGTWRVRMWEVRQGPMSDADRKSRQRNRAKSQQYHGTVTNSVTIRDTDIDIDKEEDIYNARARANTHTKPVKTHSGSHYEHTPPGYEAESEYITALAKTVKQTYAVGINEADFKAAAHALIDGGYSVDDVTGFGTWWRKNGHYKGKPALKSLVQEIGNMRHEAGGSDYFNLEEIYVDDSVN